MNGKQQLPVPSAEAIAERIKNWESLQEKYSNIGDADSKGLELDTLVALEDAAEKRAAEVYASKEMLKHVFDDVTDEEADDEDKSESDFVLDFVDKDEEKPTELVLELMENAQNSKEKIICQFSPEFVESVKQAMTKQNEELSKMNLSFWSATSSSSRFHEKIDENLTETSDSKKFSRQYESSYECKNSAMNFNCAPPEPLQNVANAPNNQLSNLKSVNAASTFYPSIIHASQAESGISKDALDFMKAQSATGSCKIIERQVVVEREFIFKKPGDGPIDYSVQLGELHLEPYIEEKPAGVQFTDKAKEILKNWMEANTVHPYPTRDQKKKLCHQTGLKMKQVSGWFKNARRRQRTAVLLLNALSAKKEVVDCCNSFLVI